MFERMKISKGTLDKLKTPVYGQRQYDHKQSRRELFDTSKLVSYDMEMK